MTVTTAYQFALTCLECGGVLEEQNRAPTRAAWNMAVLCCSEPDCRQHYELAVRLTPMRVPVMLRDPRFGGGSGCGDRNRGWE